MNHGEPDAALLHGNVWSPGQIQAGWQQEIFDSVLCKLLQSISLLGKLLADASLSCNLASYRCCQCPGRHRHLMAQTGPCHMGSCTLAKHQWHLSQMVVEALGGWQ